MSSLAVRISESYDKARYRISRPSALIIHKVVILVFPVTPLSSSNIGKTLVPASSVYPNRTDSDNGKNRKKAQLT